VKIPKVSLNIAELQGGEALNIVPASACCRINARSFEQDALAAFSSLIHELAEKIGKEEGVKFHLKMEASKEAKPFDKNTETLFSKLEQSADFFGMRLNKAASGGLSDGNILHAAGLPNLDSLGVIGGNLHTPEEWMKKKSLVERAKLSCHLLFHLAGEN
jgi:glutamate carboxypeptidase